MTRRDTEMRRNNLTAQPRPRLGAGTAASSEQAIERAKAGDSEGLHFLYVRYAPDVQRYVTSFVRTTTRPKTSPRTSSPS